MQTFSFSFAGARLAFLLDITRNDETVIRVTNTNSSVSLTGASPDIVWLPAAGLEIGDVTHTNDGTLPTFSFSASADSNGPFDPLDIDSDLFQAALVELWITDAANPVAKDFQFKGRISQVDYDLAGHVSFEVLSFYATPRDIFIRQYGIPCDADFGDPRRCKIPTFADLEIGSSDLHDVARLETIAVGDRRRFRFAAGGTPDDYANVYLECYGITTGITAGSAPAYSSTVGDTVTDGGVFWITRNAWARYAQVGTLYDTRNFLLDNYVEPRATANSWLTPGRLVVRSGYAKNMVAKIRTWDAATGQIEILQPIAGLLNVGDWLEVAKDCNHTIDMCVDDYNNADNYRGFPYLTGSKLVTSTVVPGVTPPSGSGSGGGSYSAFAVEFAAGLS